MGSYILAHDLGTSGNKATLFSTKGRLLGSQTRLGITAFIFKNKAVICL